MESLLSIVILKEEKVYVYPLSLPYYHNRLLDKVKIKISKNGLRLDGKAISR